MATTLPTPTVRPRGGRWLGGVCAALAQRSGLPVARVRAGFAIAGVLFGLGVLVYAAAWLILPGEDESGTSTRGIVLLAQAAGTLIGLFALGVAGAVATVFGFGWVVAAVAGAILVATLIARLDPAWALLPVAALVVPAEAMSVAGIELPTTTSSRTLAPRSVAALPSHVRTGLGPLTIDLRHTALPADGTIDLKVSGGVRRTLIALPHDRCVKVEVNTQPVPTAVRAAAFALGRGTRSAPTVESFGKEHQTARFAPVGRVAGHSGPTLRIDYSSYGGTLVVRDYPDNINPRSEPDWPGFRVYPEPRPDTTSMTRSDARTELADWRVRHAEELAAKQRIDPLLPGPCAQKELFP